MRIALIRSSGSSAWQSCVSITYNLARAYEALAGHEIREFALESSSMAAEIPEILSYSPDLVAVIDYGSFQPAFMKEWIEDENAIRVPVVLHCFGDFPLAASAWTRLAPKLVGLPIRFVSASEASAELIAGLLSSDSANVAVLPFPIDSETFRPAPARGAKLRRALRISPRELVLLYTGRISLQKNTTLLARLAREYSRARRIPITLMFAGEVDDIGADFLGIDLSTGFYRQHFYNELRSSLDGDGLRIAMLGHLDPDGLREAYNAADVFVSLSMHHDEDFGMSPGESLCCGTPVILSGWGGFHSFPAHVDSKLRSQAARIVELESTGTNVGIRTERFFEALDHHRAGASTSEFRTTLARGAAASLGIPAGTARLKDLLAENIPVFSGFSPLFENLAGLMHAPGRFRSRRFDDRMYRRIYRPYFAPNEASRPSRPGVRGTSVGETTITKSAITASPLYLKRGPHEVPIVPISGDACLDLVYPGKDAVEVHGWCLDLVHDRAPDDICVFNGPQRVPGTVAFKVRSDVQDELGLKFDRGFRPGFELHLPKENLRNFSARDLFSVVGIFDHDLALEIGQFRLDPKTFKAGIMPPRNRALGTYVPLRLGKEEFTLQREYRILQTASHHRIRLSTCKRDAHGALLAGWAVDLETGTPPEAMMVCGEGEQALVFPVQEQRPALRKARDRALLSGFRFRVPWKKPKLYALFASGVAVEVPL